MIAIDTSTWVAYFGGGAGADVELLDRALADRLAVLPAPVLTELLSEPNRSDELIASLLALPLLETTAGFWERAGLLRSKLLGSRRKAGLGDALVGQLCLDHGVALITRDRDFRAYAELAGVDVAVP